MNKKKLLQLLIGIFCLGALEVNAQIELQLGGTPESLANLINGNGVQILNPTINCADSAYGAFDITSIPNFPTSQGLVLSTGNIFDMSGPNITQSTTTIWGTPGDPQVSTIAGATSFDACVFEFDVVPVGDTLRFNFTFASEEYQEYVGTIFNDAFAFLISGPGIIGTPGLGGFENIALVPGTTTPVGINTVNNGNPDIGFGAVNPEFFISNPTGFGTLFEYDGFTTGLFAEKALAACDTFRLRLVIADVGDREWDSSVFIESIESNSITLTATTDGEIEEMIEGCNDGTITFSRTPVSSSPLEVAFFIGGTAINGVDYPLIGDPDPEAPKFVTIPANEASVSISIEPIDDGLVEGEETIVFYIGNPLCPGTIQDSLSIVILDELEVNITPPLVFLCPGDSFTFTVNTIGTGFDWSPVDFLNDPTIKAPTASPPTDVIYTLTTTVSECVASATGEIRVSNIELNFDLSQIECGGTNDGAIETEVSGGETPYEFAWTGPNGFSSIDQNISGLAPGEYNLIVTDREGCTDSATVNISEIAALELSLTSPEFTGGNNVSCNNASDGAATVVATGGTPGYTYLWDDPSSSTSQTITGLPAGTYTVTVTDINGCSTSESITLTAPAAIFGELVDRDDVLCFGDATGMITIAAAGGTAPYNYLWNTVPPQTGPTASGLVAGTYGLTITDVNGCIGFAEAEIQEPDAPLSGAVNVVPPTCNGLTNGSATASIDGGTPPYTYIWSPAPGENNSAIGGLSAGGFNLTVVDDNGCQLSIPFNVSQPTAVNINIISLDDADCFGAATGSVTVFANGGTSPYLYSWNTVPVTNGPTLTSAAAGNYVVTVTDINGCTGVLEVEIGEPSEIVSLSANEITNPACDGFSDGSIVVIADGGTSPYTFSWNTIPPTTGATLADVPEGIYTVTVTDINGCEAQESFELTAPEPIVIAITDVQNVLCNGDPSGSATAQPTGGSPTYDYLWDDPSAQTTPTANNLSAGTYIILVTDAAGCTASTSVNITEPATPLGGAILTVENVLCFGDNNGFAQVTGTGGSGSYSYQWDDPASQTGSVASELSPGVYNVTITDNNGCDTPFVLQVTIEGPAEALALDLLPSIFAGGFNVACSGDSTATVDLTITGGTAPYDVLWNLPGIETSTDQNLINLAPGTYTVTVTDASGCSAEESIDLSAPTPIEFTAETTPSLCFGLPQGSISIEISGGVPGYSPTWTGPNGFVGSGTEFIDIEGGIYLLTIEDANGCILNDAVTVIQPEDLTIDVDSISDYNGFNTTCWNSQNGAIFITPGGGTTPYGYTWNSPGNPGFSNQQDVTNVGPGTYEVVLIDLNGCVQNEFIEIVGPDTIAIDFNLSLYANGFNVSCNGGTDGTIEALVTGGTPTYNFIWIGTNGYGPVFTNPVENLEAGEYSVLVQDANNCFFANSVSINEPPAFSLTIFAESTNGSNISCEGETDGAITLVVTGSSGPYTFAWTGPDGFESSAQNLTNLNAGAYCVVVTDNNDCAESQCIDLIEPTLLELTITTFEYPGGGNVSCGGASDGSITSTISGGTLPAIYSWTGPNNFTSNSPNINNIPAGTYCLSITDANGCEAQTCVELTGDPELTVDLELTNPLVCNGDNTAGINATVSGGNTPFNFSWTGPNSYTASTQNIDNLLAGQYCLTVTDVEDCSTIACITVVQPSSLTMILTGTAYEGGSGVTCNGVSDGSIVSTVVSDALPLSYQWSGPNDFTADTPAIENLSAGTYCLTVTDSNECEITDCISLTEPLPLTGNANITLPDCSDSGLADVSLTINGGTAPYSYNWSNNQNGPNVTLDEGIYSVIVTDANDCSIVVSVVIEFPSAIFVTLSSPLFPGGVNVTCAGEPSGIINANITGGQGDLDFEWSGTGNFFSDEENLIGMNAGTYCLTVTDEFGCTGSACITLTEPAALAINLTGQDLSCEGDLSGSVTANVTGGVPVYAITWTGPNGFVGNGTTISQLEAGEYCAIVTDINGCNIEECITLEESNALVINLSSPEVDGVNIACFGDNSGSITSVVSEGTPGYTYSWSGPGGFFSPSPNIENLFAGEYCLSVTDANGCIAESCITLTEAMLINVDVSILEYANGFNISCGGVCDGSLSTNIAGGSAPYTLSWVGPNNFTSDQSNLSDLCAGVYLLSVTDANGCAASFEANVQQAIPIEIALDSPAFPGGTEISCFGFNNAIINTTVNGGVANFSYEWTGPNDFESNEVNPQNLGPGTYTLALTDANGCTADASITITEPESPLIGTATAFEFPSGDNISCLGVNDGSIESIVTGGTAPYGFNWLGPDDFDANTADISGLAPGLYTLVIEDANSCVFTINVTLTEPETALEADIVEIVEIECFNTAAGALEVSATGGNSPYEILWIGPNGFTSDNFAVSDLPPGTYTYAVTDVNGCSVSGAFTLVNPLEIAINANIVSAFCESETGIINTTISGGNPPYSYLWDTGADTQNLIDLAAGTYELTVQDQNGCENSAIFTVESENNLAFEALVTEPNCFGENTGVLQVTLVSGAEPATLVWEGPNDFTGSGNTLVDITSGNYTLTALDANGCTINTGYIVGQPDSLYIEELVSPLYSNGFNLSAYQSNDGVINNPSIVGGTLPFNLIWTGPDGFNAQGAGDLAALAAGTYTLNVIDAGGCGDTALITLIEPVSVELPNGISPNGDGLNDGLVVRGLEDFPSNILWVYNRWGNLLYEEANYSNSDPWVGVNQNGEQLPQGTYFVIVDLEGRDSLRGYLEIRR